ncbi:RHS repeat-associated core domain-containing protein [Enhygromyxa salina]|uniref:RHS repeat-associated core domain-containing protein n=1 Tax=Enhygromyxa salina TaxID=215803 RepID=UPI002467D6EE|nr:RHS repeat-associated core domain-containing protein [Enhygromyxa salina]
MLPSACVERPVVPESQPRSTLDIHRLEPPGHAPGEPRAFTDCPEGACPREQAAYLFSGEFHERVVDLRVQSCTVGLDLVWARRYRSRVSRHPGETPLGNNWDHSYNIYIELGAGPSQPIMIYDGDARPAEFSLDSSHQWTAPGYHRVGTFDDDGRFVLTFADGGTWTFNAAQDSARVGTRKLRRITDRNHNIVELEYDDNDRLEQVVNAVGQSLDFEYDATDHITKVTAQLGPDTSRTIHYDRYAADDPGGNPHDLRRVTLPPIVGTVTGNDFPDGTSTTYTYATGTGHTELDGNLLTIEDSLGQIYLRNTYSDTQDPGDFNFDRLLTQAWGNSNDRISMIYASVEPSATNNFAITMAWVNDRVGRVSSHFFDGGNHLVLRREYTGFASPDLPSSDGFNPPGDKLRGDDPEFFETRFAYNVDGHVIRVTHPRGNATVSVYEGDLNAAASPRVRGNLRERHLGLDIQACDSGAPKISEYFEYVPGLGNEHDQQEFVARATDPRGNVTQTSHDGRGNRISIIYPEPDTREDMQYNVLGQLTRHRFPKDQHGARRELAFTYEHEGRLRSEIEDPQGLALTTTTEFDAACNEVRRIDPAGNDKLYSYNSHDELVRELSPLTTCSATCGGGTPTRAYTDRIYDANMNLVRVDEEALDCEGNPQANAVISTFFEYDILNELTLTSAELDEGQAIVNLLSYDANRELTTQQLGEAVSQTDPFNTVSSVYDERGLLYQEIRGQGSPLAQTTQHDYDANGNERRVLEGPTRVTNYVYDCADRLVSIQDTMGNQTTYRYDPAGNRVEERFEGELVDLPGASGNLLSRRTTVSYDTMNRPVVTTRDHFDPMTQTQIGDGASVTTLAYDGESRVILETDDSGGQTTHDFDAVGRPWRTVDAEGNAVELAYDDNGNVSERELTDAPTMAGAALVGVWTYAYDEQDNLVQTTDPIGSTTHSCYDSLGRLAETVAPRQNRTTYSYDGTGRLTESAYQLTDDGTGAGSVVSVAVTRQFWDASDRLIAREDPGGNLTEYQYDSLNRVTRETYADGRFNVFTYDDHGNIVEFVDPSGTSLVFGYDRLDRRVSVAITPGHGVSADTTFERYTFDGRSLLVGADDDDSHVARRHDSLGAILAETQTYLSGPARELGYVRDALGNPTTTTYPAGRVIDRSFDRLARTRTISEGGSELVQLEYLGPSVLRRTYLEPSTRSDYSYDPARRMVGSQHVEFVGDVVTDVVDQRIYGFDDANNKQSEQDLTLGNLGGRWTITHDSLGRMVGSDVSGSVAGDRSVDYMFDGAGNRTSTSGSKCPGSYTQVGVDAVLNQYTLTPCEAWSHDPAGHLVDTSATASDGSDREFEYDHHGRLVHVVISPGAPDEVAIEFAYDALGRKIRATSTHGASSVTEQYVYDGWNVIEEYTTADWTPSATYLYGDGLDSRLQMIRKDSWWFFDDETGSTTALGHKPSDGPLLVERYSYQDFGEPSFFVAGSPAASSLSGNPYLFAGRRWLQSIGLYDLRTRHLDPVAGRFITRDSLGIWADEENLGNGYTYVTNTPGSATDPTGEWKKPHIKNCHDGARYDIEQWLGEAERQARRARSWFDGQAERKRKRRKTDWNKNKNDGRLWWGNYDNTRFHRIKWNYRKIVRRCSKNVITFKCRSTGEFCGFTDSSAWTHSSWHAWIRVCKNGRRGMFRSNGTPRYDSKIFNGGTILHEVSHNINAIGDKRLNGSKVSLHDEVQELASRKPVRASWNAANYEHYGASR